jgi:hypothetical protein
MIFDRVVMAVSHLRVFALAFFLLFPQGICRKDSAKFLKLAMRAKAESSCFLGAAERHLRLLPPPILYDKDSQKKQLAIQTAGAS